MASFAQIALRHGATLLLQFGSTASGREHADSDVDVAVLFDGPPPGLLEQGALAAELGGCFPGRDVDLAVLDRADPLFLKQILDECVLLAGSPRRLAELRMYAFRRYQDHKRYLALEEAYVERTLAEMRR